MKIRIKRIDTDLPLPQYQTHGSVGFDLYSRIDDMVKSRKAASIPSNLIIQWPSGYFLMIAARSSLHKKGLMLANGIGIIDQDFSGTADEINILVYNFSDTQVEIKRGERIAQGLILPVERAEWDEQDEMGENSRGGFGSTG